MNTQEGSERDFLHDIAGPLGTALFVADAIRDDLPAENKGMFDELLKALQSASAILTQRREVVKRREGR